MTAPAAPAAGRTPRPTRALVLAAGLGTRLRPLTLDQPKALLPVWGVPALEHALRLLRSWGVRDVVVNLHHRPGDLLHHCAHRPPDGLRLALSFEPDLLGTGGALRRAAWFFGRDPFWLLNADVLADLDPAPLRRALRREGVIAAVWTDPARGPRTVEVERGLVTAWRSAAPGRPGTRTYCGLSLIRPALLDPARAYVPAEGAASLVSAYEAAARDGWRVAAVDAPGSFWADIGTPEQYLDAHRAARTARRAGARGARLVDPPARARAAAARRRGARLAGFVAVGEGVTLGRGARVRDSVLLEGARVGPGAALEGALVGRGARVEGKAAGVVVPASLALDADETRALRRIGFDPVAATAYPLGPRGSQRTFTLVRARAGGVVLVRYDPARPENPLYAGHARLLRRLGVPVPRVLVDNPAARLLVLEDLGDESLQTRFASLTEREIRTIYRRVLDAVRPMHARGLAAARRCRLRLVPGFREKLYRWEHDYFVDHFLVGRLRLTGAEVAAVRADLERCMRRLLPLPRVLIHRDFQSSNILLRRGRPWFIDFQGMRPGPAVYDLASLLCDPYVELPRALRDELLEYYLRRSAHAERLRAAFPYAAVQRLGQALGAYARLGASPGTQAFAAHIPPALRNLREMAETVDDLPALRALLRHLA